MKSRNPALPFVPSGGRVGPSLWRPQLWGRLFLGSVALLAACSSPPEDGRGDLARQQAGVQAPKTTNPSLPAMPVPTSDAPSSWEQDRAAEPAGSSEPARSTQDVVVLVHGLGRSCQCFSRLAPALGRAGYALHRFDYPSLEDGLERHGRALRELLDRLQQDSRVRRIHLVSHSMGGPVSRVALGDHPPQKVRRVVMLAPPNHGSDLAAMLESTLGRLVPAVAELSSSRSSPVHSLPDLPAGVEVGILAASFDHAVSRRSTRLEGQTDHRVIGGMHGSMPYQKGTRVQVLHFLEHGRFQHR